MHWFWQKRQLPLKCGHHPPPPGLCWACTVIQSQDEIQKRCLDVVEAYIAGTCNSNDANADTRSAAAEDILAVLKNMNR